MTRLIIQLALATLLSLAIAAPIPDSQDCEFTVINDNGDISCCRGLGGLVAFCDKMPAAAEASTGPSSRDLKDWLAEGKLSPRPLIPMLLTRNLMVMVYSSCGIIVM